MDDYPNLGRSIVHSPDTLIYIKGRAVDLNDTSSFLSPTPHSHSSPRPHTSSHSYSLTAALDDDDASIQLSHGGQPLLRLNRPVSVLIAQCHCS